MVVSVVNDDLTLIVNMPAARPTLVGTLVMYSILIRRVLRPGAIIEMGNRRSGVRTLVDRAETQSKTYREHTAYSRHFILCFLCLGHYLAYYLLGSTNLSNGNALYTPSPYSSRRVSSH